MIGENGKVRVADGSFRMSGEVEMDTVGEKKKHQDLD